MQLLNKNTTNELVFTLNEKSTLTDPFWLFEFTPSVGDVVYFNATDVSPYPRRYNLFEVVEDAVPDPSNGIIELLYGFGTYRVYESTTQTLDPIDTTGIVIEEGKYFVEGWDAPIDSGFNNQNIYI